MRYLVLALSLAVPTITFAAAADSAPQAGEVVITAARTPIPLESAGSGTTVISREEIEARSPQFLSDLLRDVPGFAVTRNGGTGQQTQLRVRGAEANHVLVLIDGIEANDLTRDDAFDFSHLLAADVERVEIVRGPQSALWGSDALAGVVNIITRRATGTRAALAVETGSNGTVDTRASVGGARGDFDGSFSLDHFQTDGINVSQRGSEADSYRNTTLNTRAGWQALPELRLELSGRYTRADVDTDGDLGLGIPSDTNGATAIEQAYTALRGALDTLDGHWRHEAYGSYSHMGNRDLDPQAFIDAEVTGDKYKTGYQSSLRGTTEHWLPAAHVLTIAFDYERQTFRQRGPVSIFGDPNMRHALQVFGYAGEYRLTVLQNSTLTVSGRWDDNDSFADIGTWRVAFSQVFPATGTTLSTAYGTGQKAPTFYDRFGFSTNGLFSPVFIGNPNLEPEKSRGWELGLQQALWQDRLRIGATYFNERLTDEINGYVTDALGLTATALNQPGTSHRDGVEFSLRARPARQWETSVNYTWLDANQIDRATGRRVEEIRRPPQAVSASARWKSEDLLTSFDLHLTHSGARQDDTFLPPLYAAVRTTLDDYTLVGITARRKLLPWLSLQARLENVLDQQHVEVFGFRSEGFSGYVGLSATAGQ